MTFEEYIKKTPRFKKQAEEFIRGYNNSGAYEKLRRSAFEQTSYMKYSRGGAVLHRGILCPNFFKDRITGKMNRGRFIKSYRGGKNVFKYHFDAVETLICVEVNSNIPDTFEFLLYDGNLCWGLQYYGSTNDSERRLSCIYCTMIKAGRIEMDLVFGCSGRPEKPISESEVWVFDYNSDVPVSITKRLDFFSVALPSGISDMFFQEDYSLHSNEVGVVDSCSYISHSNNLTRSYPSFSIPKPLDKAVWQNVYGMTRCVE